MKRKLILTAIFATLMVGSQAFATISRLAVMGTQPLMTDGNPFFAAAVVTQTNAVNGSLWYDDAYNVFYNPSYVNDYKNYVVVEKGVEGGWFSSIFDNFVYGIYVNRGGTGGAEANYGNENLVGPGLLNKAGMAGPFGAAQLAGTAAVSTQRPIDFFIGGDTGIKWGAHVAWAYNRNQTVATAAMPSMEQTARYWHFDFGAQFMGFEPFIGATVFSEAQVNSAVTVGGVNLLAANSADQNLYEVDFGFKYKYENWTPYLVFKKYREGGTPVGGTTGAPIMQQTRMNIWGLGLSHDTKVTEGVHIVKHMGFFVNSVEDDLPANVYARDFKQYIMPLNVAFEADATSWLTLRAGIHFDVFNQGTFKQSALPTATAMPATSRSTSLVGVTRFRIGSTLKFGKLSVDSAFGANVGGATSAAPAATNGIDMNNNGFDSQTFAMVSARYNW